MPSLSSKGKLAPQSPIRKLTPFAEKAKKEGKIVYHLNIGQPDIETPKQMLEAVRNIDFKVWAYTASEGIASYRKKLAEFYQRIDYPITDENILVTNGASEAINLLFLTCLNPGEEIIIPEPFYANYNGFAYMADVVIKPISSSIDTGFALPPIEEFEKLITPKTKAVMICNPNNPTGYLYSQKEIEGLKDLALKHDLYIFSDEAYREFCYGDEKFFSPMHLSGIDDNVVIVDSVSKRYSACGARLGCILTKNNGIIENALKFAQQRLSPPLVGQIAAEAAVDTPQSYFDAVKKEYMARRDLLVQGLNKIAGVYCPNPGGAFYVVAQLPISDSDDFCKWMLDSFSYKNQTVMMAPATGFYATPGKGKNEVRVAYVLNQEEIEKALVCIEEGLKAYPGRVK